MKLLRSIVPLFFSVCVTAQDTVRLKPINFKTGVLIEYIEQDVKLMSVGGCFLASTGPRQWFGTGMCLDASLTADTLLLAPRIYIEEVFHFGVVRINVSNFIRNGRTHMYVIPELGVTLKGRISLYVGYGVNAPRVRHFDDISKYRITFSYKFVKQ